MRLRVKITCQNIEKSSFTEFLKESCDTPALLKAHSVRNGVIFDPLIQSQSDVEAIYAMPRDFSTITSKVTFLMDISEHGGFNTKTGEHYSNIVCGKSGKPLKPYYVPRKHVNSPCGQHAYFSVPESVITINAFSDENIRIYENRIDTSLLDTDNVVKILHTVLYDGALGNLPSELERFTQAASVAVDKANCADCTHIHYFMDASIFKNIRYYGT